LSFLAGDGTPGGECCAHSRCRMTLLLSCGRHLSDQAQAAWMQWSCQERSCTVSTQRWGYK